jgi:CRISPR/Cas system CSM-associated protein Csm5 (group 7 of RAMP superfamily)
MMIDLMYFGYTWDEDSRKNEVDFIKEIKEKFPNVELHNAYDDIKGYRQEVCLEDEQTDDYMAFLFGNGWYELSLTLQIDMMTEEKTEQVRKWIELAKKQYPQNFKKS